MAKIAIDIDNTLYDFDTPARNAFLALAKETGDKTLLRGAYNPWVEWRSLMDVCGEDVGHEVISRVHADDAIMQRRPYEGVSEVIGRLLGEGHEILYISTRSPAATDATATWLGSYGLMYGGDDSPTKLLCTWDDKQRHIFDCQYLIDDRVKTIHEFLGNYEWKNTWGSKNEEKKRLAFALWHPYNLNLTDIPNLYLAPTWDGIGHYLEEKGVLNGRRIDHPTPTI